MVEIAYVDSSVMVKHYVESEGGSSLASEYITSYQVYASIITQIEVFSALARKFQLKEISKEDVETIKDNFFSDCERMGFIEVSEDVISESRNLVFKIQIKTLAAIHLASAIMFRRDVGISAPLITSDKKLALAAEGEGFDVFQVSL